MNDKRESEKKSKLRSVDVFYVRYRCKRLGKKWVCFHSGLLLGNEMHARVSECVKNTSVRMCDELRLCVCTLDLLTGRK